MLCPNYRGSTGYGDKFVTDLIGHENDLDVEDILKGVDALVEQRHRRPGPARRHGLEQRRLPDQLHHHQDDALQGGHQRRRHRRCRHGVGLQRRAGLRHASSSKGFPWSKPDKYHKTSPTYQLDKVRTPTLIHVGGNDDRCPPGHSRMLYRALKEYVKVPTELVVYPGEAARPDEVSRIARRRWNGTWPGSIAM